MAAICSLLVYSCSTERDEEVKVNPAEKVKIEKLELKKLKPIKPGDGQANRTESDTAKAPTPIAYPSNGGVDTGLEPDPDINPNPNDPEIIPPGDVRPPKK